MTETVKMTKPNGGATAVANVPADQVDAWAADGWKAEKPKRTRKAANE